MSPWTRAARKQQQQQPFKESTQHEQTLKQGKPIQVYSSYIQRLSCLQMREEFYDAPLTGKPKLPGQVMIGW